MTFGYKMATILAAVERHRERLAQLKPRVLVGEFGGACGTLASIETGAMETQAGLMAELGLGQPAIAWHTVRDNIAEVGCFLGLVGGTLGKIAMDVKLMMQTEVARGVRAVRARPRLQQHHAAEAQSDLVVLHPRRGVGGAPARGGADGRDDRRPRALDRAVGDRVDRRCRRAFCLMAGALKQTRFVLEGLEVDAAKMRANIDLTNGLVMSEAVMMGLGRHIGREYAHDLVYDICREALGADRPLLDLLAEHPEISRHLDRAALAKLCDPANYLGQAGVMVDRVLAAQSRCRRAT